PSSPGTGRAPPSPCACPSPGPPTSRSGRSTRSPANPDRMARGAGIVGRLTPTRKEQNVAQIALTPDGSPQHIDEGTTGTELFASTASTIALRTYGARRDRDTALADGQAVEGVDISSPDGLSILRHSTAHVLAQAVQRTNPDAKLGIGPPITDGFYYDFDVAEPFTPEALKALEKEMNRIVKSGQRFVRREISDDAARAEESSEPYKLEL